MRVSLLSSIQTVIRAMSSNRKHAQKKRGYSMNIRSLRERVWVCGCVWVGGWVGRGGWGGGGGGGGPGVTYKSTVGIPALSIITLACALSSSTSVLVGTSHMSGVVIAKSNLVLASAGDDFSVSTICWRYGAYLHVFFLFFLFLFLFSNVFERGREKQSTTDSVPYVMISVCYSDGHEGDV
jgi:hypothetical protein